MPHTDFTIRSKQLIDDLKGICSSVGLGGDANEYKIVTQSFLYKFLNDKFLHEVGKLDPNLKSYEDLIALGDDEYELLMIRLGTKTAHLKPEHLLENLFAHQNDDDFAKLFDNTLNDIAVDNSDVFSVHTAGNTEIRLFEEELIADAVNDKSQHDITARKIINKLANSKFELDEILSAGFDFFSTLFEYMIKDYNKDGGGKYAEYYTPHSIAKIMAEILVGDDAPLNVSAYDPAAGSGTLLMNIAHKIGENKCTIYSQDMSQKSSNLLRLNLILNGLSHSIDHIVQGNTIAEPRHVTKKFDYIVSNPPFKLDFSEDHEKISSLPNTGDRFFAGIPNIPKQSKDTMAIYLLFLQHIMFSLSGNGRAAVVVPTGFLTAQSGIEKTIREKIVNQKMLRGIVTMPSHIFATTSANVSVIFLDKNNTDSDIVLVDASGLGKKIKEGKNQRTILSVDDERKIVGAFNGNELTDDFSVAVSYEDIKLKNHSFAANQYFKVKHSYLNLSPEEFENKLITYSKQLDNLFTLQEVLEAIADTTYAYWFRQFDFPSKDGLPYRTSGGEMIWNDILDKEIPIGWKVDSLGKVLRTALGGTPSTKEPAYWDGGNIPWISSGEVDAMPILSTEGFITELGLQNSPAILLPKGSLIISIVRYIRVSVLGIDAATNQSVVGIKENATLKNNYLYPFLKSQIPLLMSKRTGAQQPHINKGEVDSLPLLIPDEEVLKNYYAITSSIYEALVNHHCNEAVLKSICEETLPSLINPKRSVE